MARLHDLGDLGGHRRRGEGGLADRDHGPHLDLARATAERDLDTAGGPVAARGRCARRLPRRPAASSPRRPARSAATPRTRWRSRRTASPTGGAPGRSRPPSWACPRRCPVPPIENGTRRCTPGGRWPRSRSRARPRSGCRSPPCRRSPFLPPTPLCRTDSRGSRSDRTILTSELSTGIQVMRTRMRAVGADRTGSQRGDRPGFRPRGSADALGGRAQLGAVRAGVDRGDLEVLRLALGQAR